MIGLVVATGLLASSGVEGAAQAADRVPDSALQLLYGDGRAPIRIAVPRGVGKAAACAAPGAEPSLYPGTKVVKRSLYPGTGIFAVTRSSPFQPWPELNEGRCDIVYHARPLPRRRSNDFAFARCAVTIRDQGSRHVVDLSPLTTTDDRFVLAECFYRLALHLEGYRGALTVPTASIFEPTAMGFYAGQRRWVGPFATIIPTRLEINCPTLAGLYYRDDLPERIASRCPSALRR